MIKGRNDFVFYRSCVLFEFIVPLVPLGMAVFLANNSCRGTPSDLSAETANFFIRVLSF